VIESGEPYEIVCDMEEVDTMKRTSRHGFVALSVLVMVTTVLIGSARALEMTTPMAIHSYFEGLRGRLPVWSPATTDDPVSLWINPAALGTAKSTGFAYLHTFNDSTLSGDDALAVSIGNLAFGAEFMSVFDPQVSMTRKKTRRYTLALGQRLGRGLYVGTSYSWLSSEICDLEEGSTWSAGFLLRPHRIFSLGAVARDLNRPTYYGNEFKPILETAIGFRPIGEKMTVFANYLMREKELDIRTPSSTGGTLLDAQPKSFLTYGVEIEPVDGVVLRFAGDDDENISGSIAIHIGQAGLTSAFTSKEPQDGEDEKRFGTALVTQSSFWRDCAIVPRKGYLEFNLDGQIGESQPPFSFFGGGPRYTLRQLLDGIERAKASPDIRAILLRCGAAAANFAIYDEMRQALLDFRKTGKKVIAYIENPGNGVYYLASASDYVILTPNGWVGLVGFKSETMFLRGTLEKLGIEAKYARVGKYKSAVEPVTEDQYTEPGREALNAVLDDIYDKFVRDIALGRGMSEEETRDAIDRGPYIPSDALREGLVDTLAYWDEVSDIVKKIADDGLSSIRYAGFSRRRPARLRWDEPPVIGIVYGVGGIASGRNRRDMFMGDIMGSETIGPALKAMREDKSVEAVVFRVDSPGGMMTASDKIRREVELTAKKKPVIISMGGVAGSGGYHISCTGTTILADEATITGSIGVLNLWLHTKGFYRKIGANKDIFLRGENADFMPTWRDVTDDDMELIQAFVDKYYDKFVADVSKGRGMGVDEVHEIAQGRIWSGKEATELGLVDRVGGLKAAIRLAKKEAGIPEDEEVDFKVLPRPRGFFETMMSSAVAKVTGQVKIPDYLSETLKEAAYLSEFDEPILYLMPYRIEIE
jgi:protease-4